MAQSLAEQAEYWQQECTDLNMDSETAKIEAEDDRAQIEKEKQKLI